MLIRAVTFIAQRAGTLALGAVVLLVATLSGNASDIADLEVEYDQVRLMRLEEPISDILLGNPSIADVVVRGGDMLAITGKTFGVTNLILLNNQGQVITHRRLVVRADQQKFVNLNRGGSRETYNCAPRCEPVLKVGDDPKYYGVISDSSQAKFRISSDTSGGGPPPQ